MDEKRQWKAVFATVPDIVAVKGVCVNGRWTLFWKYKRNP